MFDHRLFTLRSPYLGRRNTQEIPPLGTQSTQQWHEGSETIFAYDSLYVVWNNVRYDKKFAILVHRGYGPQKVQKWAENTSNLHCSTHSCAHSIIFHLLPSIQILIIPSYAPNMCVDGDR